MKPHAGARLARCARRLGFDRNPLRRRTDRIEAVIRLAVMMAGLAASVLVLGSSAPQAHPVKVITGRQDQGPAMRR